jgi:uncharacterized membrane protein YfcA
MTLSLIDLALITLAALAAGMVNALAGGGTLITFPMLTAVGVPAVAANITNAVALCPGYLGGSFAQAKDLAGQRSRLVLLVPLGVLGGLIGGYLLVHTGEKVFRTLVPYLVFMASGLLAAQDPLRRWLVKHAEARGHDGVKESWAAAPITFAAVYGGYFGAGLGVIMLATLSLTLDDTLVRLNAVKQLLSLVINLACASYFLFSGQVVWPAALVMAIGALTGGTLGGRLAGRIRPATLRYAVVAIGIIVGCIYLVR